MTKACRCRPRHRKCAERLSPDTSAYVSADPDRLGRDAGRIAQEVVAHLHGLVGTDTEVTIEIRATNPDGFPETVVKIVSENAGALRFTDHGFENS